MGRNKARKSGKAKRGEANATYKVGDDDQEVTQEVDDLLASAWTNDWVILLDAEKRPSGLNAWCPALQPMLFRDGDLATQLRNIPTALRFRVLPLSDVMRDAKSDLVVKELIQLLEAAESSHVSMLNLLKEEGDAGLSLVPKKKVKKQVKSMSSAQVGNYKEDVSEHEAIDEAMGVADGECAHPTTDEIMGVVEPEHVAKGEKSLELHEDDFLLKNGRIIHNGKELSGLEMLVQLMKGQKSLQQGVQCLEQGLQCLEQGQKQLQKDVRDLNKSLSSVAERLSRYSLSLLYEHCKDVKVQYPVTSRWIPYDANKMGTVALENLSKLWEESSMDNLKKNPSGLVEIDVSIKVLNEEANQILYFSPMKFKTSRLPSHKHPPPFTNVVIGEYSRSVHLCANAAAYEHPEKPCRTPSAKLLKKLIQVERGIVATLFYYGAAGNAAVVDAAAVISPSFRQLADPDSLLGEVLSHTEGALPHVSRLANDHCMWLIDA